MVAVYKINIKDVEPGKASHSGHETYIDAVYKPNSRKIIYKKNKFGNPLFSRLEVSFSQLAKLFLAPGLTSSQCLVVDDHHVINGLAVDHLCYAIADKEGLERQFYKFLKPKVGCMESKKITDAKDIPIYFLDKFPQGFFAQLIEEEKAGRLTINYESLASILATSYTLEEDDLHKGNFGFYLIEKAGKAHIVFFKIDHDLMFVDSIMGFESRRPFHLFHGKHAFDITTEDLSSFANLKHSSNGYWPTKFGYVSNPCGGKEYHSFAETRAFSRLAQKSEFIKGKWKAFYKHILIPTELIQETLKQSSDFNIASDRAHIALMTQSMVARLAHLRAALFSIPDFREYVVKLSKQENEQILHEIIPPIYPLEKSIAAIQESIISSFEVYKNYATNGFEEKDTPLHTIIKLGEYRYEETTRMFSQFMNIKNSAGKTPLDIAFERFSSPQHQPNDVRTDMLGVMRHLISKGAKKSAAFKANITIEDQIAKHTFKNSHSEKITKELAYTDFKKILRDVGEDHQFCLKYKKNLAIECINKWIQLRHDQPKFAEELQRLRKEINGQASEEDCAGLKYVRRLRTELWFLRQIRGPYGITTSQVEINDVITRELERLRPKPKNYSFFNFNTEETDLGFKFVKLFM